MFLTQIANGVVIGSVYALFALGYTLVFGVLDILNLAHAAIFMVAAFLALGLTDIGVPFFAATGAAIMAAGLCGVILDRIAFAPLRRRNAGTLAPLISSIGVAFMLVGVVRSIAGPGEYRFASLPIGSLDTLSVIVAIVFMLGLGYIMRSTALGRDIRAVADDRIAALLLGIDIERTIALTFFIASALGGVAGILVGAQYNSISIEMGSRIELKGLAIIILGGMGSITGAVVGAFTLGIVETLSVAYISSSYRDAISFGVMFLILIVRPRGLFGKRSVRAA